jgi:hypothetical protein
METPVELNSHRLYLIFLDLSLDAIRRYLGSMGLGRAEDAKFTAGLASLLEPYERLPDNQRNEAEAVSGILQLAQQSGGDYRTRIMDWCRLIYPINSPRQQQIFHWRNAVMRGARQQGQNAPRLVEETRAVLRKFAPVIATDIQPATERDKLYSVAPEEQGISPFEWVEGAVRTYRFLYAWNLAVGQPYTAGEMDEVYRWALHEAELLRFPKGGLARPEDQLTLPASLRDS